MTKDEKNRLLRDVKDKIETQIQADIAYQLTRIADQGKPKELLPPPTDELAGVIQRIIDNPPCGHMKRWFALAKYWGGYEIS